MKNYPTIALALPCPKKASECSCRGLVRVVIERRGRFVGEVICESAVRMMECGIRPRYALVGWHDWYLLRNEEGIPDAEDVVLSTPAGEVQVLVDPTVETGVRLLPGPSLYWRILNKSDLLAPR